MPRTQRTRTRADRRGTTPPLMQPSTQDIDVQTSTVVRGTNLIAGPDQPGQLRAEVGNTDSGSVQYISKTSGTGSGFSITITAPASVQAGDLLLLWTVGDTDIYEPTKGWRIYQGLFDSAHAFFFRVATDNEPSSYTVYSQTSDKADYLMVCLRNADLPSQTLVGDNYSHQNFGAATGWYAPSIEASRGSLHIPIALGSGTSTCTTPTGYTSIATVNGDTALGLHAYYKEIAGDGPTGQVSLTLSSGQTGAGSNFVIHPKKDAIKVWDGEDETTTTFEVSEEGIVNAHTISRDLDVNGVVWRNAQAGINAKASNQNITDSATGGIQQITFGVAKVDTMDIYNNAADGIRLYEPGMYHIMLKVRWNADAAGDRRIFIYVNGVEKARNFIDVDTSSAHEQECHLFWYRDNTESTVYEEVTFWARQNSGSTVAIAGNGSQEETYFAYNYLGRVS